MNRGAAAVVEEFIRRQREMYRNNHRPVDALVGSYVTWRSAEERVSSPPGHLERVRALPRVNAASDVRPALPIER
jgi:hypothetical protein